MREWLRERRLEMDLTQKQVAKKVGVARTTYAMYEQGERDPSVGVAVKVADLLGFDWVVFFENKVHETRTHKKVV